MYSNKFFDFIFCTLSSVVYRFALVCLGWVIVLSVNSYFSLQVYIVSTVIYIGSITFLFIKKHEIGLARLIADYAFMLIFMYKVPLDTYVSASFLALPLINSPNHTGSRRTITIYATAVAILIVLYTVNQEFSNRFYLFLLPLFFFTVIGMLDTYKRRIITYTHKVYNLIDSIFTEELPINKLHRIYRKTIDIVNSSKVGDTVEGIICIERCENDTYRLVNASKFIHLIQIEGYSKAVSNLDGKSEVSNIPIDIDGTRYTNTVLFSVSSHKKYVYVIIFKRKIHPLKLWIIAEQILRPCFIRISQFIEFHQNMEYLQLKHAKKLKANIELLEASEVLLHSLRGKFQPILTFIQASEDIVNSIENSSERNDLTDLRLRAGKNIQQIKKLADDFLSSKRSIRFDNLSDVTFLKIYTTIKYKLDDKPEIRFDINNTIGEDHYKSLVRVDVAGFAVVVEEILQNISKHNHENSEASFSISSDDTFLYIVFCNNIVPAYVDRLSKTTTAFNTDNADEIFSKSSSGVILIKKICKQMQISTSAWVDGNRYCLQLALPKIVSNEVNLNAE